jgi:hypothetical protein
MQQTVSSCQTADVLVRLWNPDRILDHYGIGDHCGPRDHYGIGSLQLASIPSNVQRKQHNRFGIDKEALCICPGRPIVIKNIALQMKT